MTLKKMRKGGKKSRKKEGHAGEIRRGNELEEEQKRKNEASKGISGGGRG